MIANPEFLGIIQPMSPVKSPKNSGKKDPSKSFKLVIKKVSDGGSRGPMNQGIMAILIFLILITTYSFITDASKSNLWNEEK